MNKGAFVLSIDFTHKPKLIFEFLPLALKFIGFMNAIPVKMQKV